MQKVIAVRKVTPMVNQNKSKGYKLMLPVEWVEKNKLEHGGSVVVLEDKGDLILTTSTE